MTELAIFDLDGTLLDTREDLAAATNEALRRCGFPERPLSEYNLLVGRGISNLMKRAMPEKDATEENVARMRAVFFPYYDAHKCDRTRPYDGIEAMLEELARSGVKLAVASNKYQDGTEKLIRHFFPAGTFSAVFGQREGFPIKPDPQIVSSIMQECGITNRESVVYIGDSDVDMQTGQNAGVRTVGVTWGFRSKEELLSGHPWMLADSPEDITHAITEQ